MRTLLAAIAGLLLGSVALDAKARVVVFDDLSTFNAQAGSPGFILDFEGISPGTDIKGTSISGVTFGSPDGNSLLVVDQTSTPSGVFSNVLDVNTNTLPPTSGNHVLSPGGSSLGTGAEGQDSLDLIFAAPLGSFGLDILFQSLDNNPNVSFDVFDASSNLTASGELSSTGVNGGPGGSVFFGLISDDTNTDIARIILTDNDNNAIFPDNNIGYDTLRSARVVPIPSALPLLASAVGLLGWLGYCRRNSA